MKFVALDEWTEEAATAAADEAQIVLTRQHWRVISCWRELTLMHGRVPAIEEMDSLCGIEAAEIERLFPGDSRALLMRIAGLPE